jgi:hypothetical protein
MRCEETTSVSRRAIVKTPSAVPWGKRDLGYPNRLRSPVDRSTSHHFNRKSGQRQNAAGDLLAILCDVGLADSGAVMADRIATGRPQLGDVAQWFRENRQRIEDGQAPEVIAQRCCTWRGRNAWSGCPGGRSRTPSPVSCHLDHDVADDIGRLVSPVGTVAQMAIDFAQLEHLHDMLDIVRAGE